jgi:hypothetical protein
MSVLYRNISTCQTLSLEIIFFKHAKRPHPGGGLRDIQRRDSPILWTRTFRPDVHLSGYGHSHIKALMYSNLPPGERPLLAESMVLPPRFLPFSPAGRERFSITARELVACQSRDGSVMMKKTEVVLRASQFRALKPE